MKAWMLWKEETVREVSDEGCFACAYVQSHGILGEGVGWIQREDGKIMRCETMDMLGGVMMTCVLVTEEEAREEFDEMARDGWEMNIAPPAREGFQPN